MLRPFEAHAAMQRRYGDTFALRSMKGPMVVTGCPAHVRAIHGLKPEDFTIWAKDELMPLAGPTGVILVDGDAHRRMRQAMAPIFSEAAVRTYRPLMVRAVEDALAALPLEAPAPLHPFGRRIALDIIARVLFGEQAEARSAIVDASIEVLERLSPAMVFFSALRKEVGGLSPWGRFMEARRHLDGLLRAEITSRREAPQGGRLDGLVRWTDEAGAPLDDDALLDQLLVLIFAGHQTTGSSICWALAWAATREDVREALLREVDALGPSADGLLEGPYLRAFCREVLRIYPMLSDISPRLLRRPLQLGSHEVPAGTAVSVSLFMTHHNPEVYDDPAEFRPERFLERRFSKDEYVPFGGGVRRCPGSGFALQEIALATATALTRCRFSVQGPTPLRPARHNLIMGVDDRLSVVLHGRL